MTLRQFYKLCTDSFKNVSDSPAVDAREIVCHHLNTDQSKLILRMDQELSEADLSALEKSRQRRLNGEPIAYITGERGFYKCIFKVSNDTLIPRADTEILVESAIQDIRERLLGELDLRILDLCCGTGCIGISVAKELASEFNSIHLTLADLSDGALSVCRENVASLITEDNIFVEVVKSDLFSALTCTDYHVLLSNPPYIAKSVIPTLERQVQYEPKMALDGGEDGLDFVREIAFKASQYLLPGGLLQMEIGYDQGPEASLILAEDGFTEVSTIRDLGDCERVVKATN